MKSKRCMMPRTGLNLMVTELKKVASTASTLEEPPKADRGSIKRGIHALNDTNLDYGDISIVKLLNKPQ